MTASNSNTNPTLQFLRSMNLESTSVESVLRGIDKPSIRQICLAALTLSAARPADSRMLKREAKDLVAKFHAGTAADRKFDKHYAWYKGTAQKENLIPRFSYPTPVIQQAIEVADQFQADIGNTPLEEVKDKLEQHEQLLEDLQDPNSAVNNDE